MEKIVACIIALVTAAASGCNVPGGTTDVPESPTVQPGLVNPDGSAHAASPPHPVSGKTWNVVNRALALGFAIDLTDGANDDRPGIEAVCNDPAISAGDEIYFPDGVYNLRSKGMSANTDCDLLLSRDGINLRGQSSASTRFVSELPANATNTVFDVFACSDVCLSNFTVGSSWNKTFSTDTQGGNPKAGGPSFGLQVGSGEGSPCRRVTLSGIVVEKFRDTGIRISRGCRDVSVVSCVVRSATNVGDGGHGYGIVVQGYGHQDGSVNPFLGKDDQDTCYCIVKNCQLVGPYLRHGILLQYWTHNNLIQDNSADQTQLDMIDLHGEDEYGNEIVGNTLQDSVAGSGVGLGNDGSGHDRSGPSNYIHDNTVVRCKVGVSVQYATADATIADNRITGPSDKIGSGVSLGRAIRCTVSGNIVTAGSGYQYVGLFLHADPAAGAQAAGAPQQAVAVGNTISVAANGLYGRYAVRVDAGSFSAASGGNTITGNQLPGDILR